MEEFSSPAYYNSYLYQAETLYAGILKERVIDKICKNTTGEYVIPPIPHEIQNCINKTFDIEIGSEKLKLEIRNPNGPGTIPLQFQFEPQNCTSKLEPFQSAVQQKDPSIIIGTSLSAGIFLVLLSVVVIYHKFCKKDDEARADENPMYEGAADYEYDNIDNCAEATDTTMRTETIDTRREVRAEVVDRNSNYGEEVEGWEGALTSDNNPDYD